MIFAIIQTLYIWAIFLILSIVFYPVAKLYFSKSFDKGWIAAKVISLLVISYTAYLIGILKIFKFSTLELWLILGFFFILIRFIFLKRNKSADKALVIDTRFIVVELIFLFLFIFMSLIRGFQPDIYGLEKFMDYGFIRSITEGSYFPPKDMWWAGEPINYYYFGHLWISVLIKIAGIDPAVGYNIGLSSIFALSTTLIIVIVRTWTKNIWFGFLGAFIHSGIGNLQFITTVFKKGWDQYWYPDASRLIPGVITEFPVYSYVVYDLHAHVINIPVAILLLGLLGQIFINKTFRYIDAVLLGFVLGICFMSNAWDLPIYLIVAFVAVVFFILKNIATKKDLFHLTKKVTLTLAIILITILPFLIFFKKIDAPILFTDYHSPIYMMFQLWGFWLIVMFSFFAFLLIFRRKIKYFDWFIVALFTAALLFLIIPEFVYVKDIYGQDYQRANTVFKLTYQSWNIFALASAYAIWRIYSKTNLGKLKLLKFVWIIVILSLVASCSAYTVKAYMTGYGDFKNFYGLNGERFIKRIYSDDEMLGINWIRDNTDSENIVLEASGDSYTDFQRISVNTGRPTVVGWAVHEWLWRGGFDPVGARQTDVQTIYTTNDDQIFKELTGKYKVLYIYLGNLEKQKYLNIPGLGITNNTTQVYSNPNVTIYMVKN